MRVPGEAHGCVRRCHLPYAANEDAVGHERAILDAAAAAATTAATSVASSAATAAATAACAAAAIGVTTVPVVTKGCGACGQMAVAVVRVIGAVARR